MARAERWLDPPLIQCNLKSSLILQPLNGLNQNIFDDNCFDLKEKIMSWNLEASQVVAKIKLKQGREQEFGCFFLLDMMYSKNGGTHVILWNSVPSNENLERVSFLFVQIENWDRNCTFTFLCKKGTSLP